MPERHAYFRGFARRCAVPCVVGLVAHCGYEVVLPVRAVRRESQQAGGRSSALRARIVADNRLVKLAFPVGIARKAEFLVFFPVVGVYG